MTIYSIADYGAMLADEVRTGTYVEALRRTVRPDSVVLDLGTGIGFLAVVAAKLGARRVYGVDANEAVEVGREIVAANGVADRVDLRRADSREIELPELADLMVCDLHGALPWALSSVPPVIDARRRLLTEDATILPVRDRLWVAVAEHAEDYHEQTAVWRRRPFDIDIEPGRDLVVNLRRRVKIHPRQLATRASEVAILDYGRVDSPDMSGSARLEVERSGAAHGLAVWFDCELGDGLSFSNRPGNELVYGQVLFPWTEEVELERGEVVEVDLEARFVNGEYVWRWSTRVGDGAETRLEMRQSNFFGVFPSRESRRARARSHRPGLAGRGRAAAAALARMEAGDDIGSIAAGLAESFPEIFDGAGEAQGFVGDLSIRFGRRSR